MRISSKLRWFILILVVCISLSVALVGYLGNSVIISDLQTEAINKRAMLEVDRLQFAFSEVNHDIRFIADLPIVQRLANTSFDDRELMDHAKDDLAAIFEQMLKAKPDYAQIRLIPSANNGLESVRVNQEDGKIYRVSEEQLQEKAHRSYFIEASQERANEIYYSDINLNQENGIIERPIRPMLRVAMPIYDSSDSFYGIVIINLNFQTFIDRVLRVGLDRSRYEYYLLNEGGYFLLHPEPTFTFGFDLGVDLKVDDEFPTLKDFMTSDSNSRTFRAERAYAWSSKRLVHFTKFKVLDPSRELVFGIVGSYDDIGRASIYTSTCIVVAICLLTLVALTFAIRFSTQITNPLESIASATRSLSDNEASSVTLPTDRGDEIGDLARTFLQMKTSIGKHQDSLVRANQRMFEMNRDLEHFARVASHDLREPIQRIAGLASLYRMECQGGVSETGDEILQKLHDECEKALVQLDDFREFTDITHDETLVREESSMNDIVSSVLDEFAVQLRQRNVQVEIDSLPTLSIYKNLVHVLCSNLVDNALRHVKINGFKLHFTCEEDRHGHIFFGVRNTGSNIEEKNTEEVFSVFNQLSTGVSSSGIGLAICKRIVDFHSGKIWVESEGDYVHVKFKLG